MLNIDEKRTLLGIARQSIKSYLSNREIIYHETNNENLKKRFGVFVTLRRESLLRGCIGCMESQDMLSLTVAQKAVDAATRDFRFSPVTLEELPYINIEISVLSQLKPVEDVKEIQMGKHGVMIRMGNAGGVFLPQVADETGWDRETFLSQLCESKSGLSKDAWKDRDCEKFIFTCNVFSEKKLLEKEDE